jgi:hypothetical protein
MMVETEMSNGVTKSRFPYRKHHDGRARLVRRLASHTNGLARF